MLGNRQLPSRRSQEFRVGVVVGSVGGGGRLLVGPGHLELRTGHLTGGLFRVEAVRHQGQGVKVYTARLLPPWMNCSVVVTDERRSVRATFPVWMRWRVVGSLQDSGFSVEVHPTLNL